MRPRFTAAYYDLPLRIPNLTAPVSSRHPDIIVPLRVSACTNACGRLASAVARTSCFSSLIPLMAIATTDASLELVGSRRGARGCWYAWAPYATSCSPGELRPRNSGVQGVDTKRIANHNNGTSSENDTARFSGAFGPSLWRKRTGCGADPPCINSAYRGKTTVY